jgi:lysophospholipase L1-like esterase
VINAGVAGYSSRQGLLRFLQEVDRYEPDLILVCFGWNDAATAVGPPDNSYRLPSWPVVWCQRALVRYRAYLVMMHYTRSWRAQPPATAAGCGQPRASIGDYLANLECFRAAAGARGIRIAVLTRPHRAPAAVLAQNPTWRGSVPRYNAALADWAASRDVPLIDVQQSFEQLPSALFADECHFTPRGYQRMAALIYDRLAAGPDGTLHVTTDPSPRPPGRDHPEGAPHVTQGSPTAARR